MLRNILLVALALTSIIGSAQNRKAIQRKITHLEAKGHYVEAAKLHISLHDEGEREASIKAGMALYRISRYNEAIYYFQHADSIGTLDSPDEIYGYFECLKALKKYDQADELIRTHLSNKSSTTELVLNAEKENYYRKIQSYQGTVIKNMPINTTYSEFGPTILDGWLYFESTRLTKENKKIHGLNNQAFFNLYAHPIGDPGKAVVLPKGNFGKPQVIITSGQYSTLSIPEDINTSHHDGPVYLTPEGKHLFYTTNWDHEGKTTYKNPYLNLGYSYNALENSQKKEIGKIHLNIYYSIRENNVWSEPVSFTHNNDHWSNQHAFFDEASSTLYFSSNRPGGMGGFDIWRSVLKNNIWSQPENLGPNVNTPRNEVFPAVSPEGYFIFASNGWPGLGGLDLFLSESLYQPPVNLMSGLNTEMDDFGMAFIRKGEGYLVSNRKESLGDDDIFEFQTNLDDIIAYNKPVVQIVLVDAVSQKSTTGTLVITRGTTVEKIQVGPEGAVVKVWGPNMRIEAEANGYQGAQLLLPFSDGEYADQTIQLNPIVKPQPVVENQDPGFRIHLKENKTFVVYLDYARNSSRNEAEKEIARLTYSILKDYRANQVSFQVYNTTADFSTADEERFHKKLKTAAAWLKARGIEPGRVVVDGKMDLTPAHDCNDQSKAHRLTDNCLNLSNQHFQKGKSTPAVPSIPLNGPSKK